MSARGGVRILWRTTTVRSQDGSTRPVRVGRFDGGTEDVFRITEHDLPGEGFVLAHRVRGVPTPLRGATVDACMELARSVVAVSLAR